MGGWRRGVDAAGRVAAELRASPLHLVDDAANAPNEAGFYVWWAIGGALAGVPATRHPDEPFDLLYIGIAPRRAGSRARVRSRLLRQHIGGNIAASTFRFGLAALLWEREGWTPSLSPSGRFCIGREDERALSAWQRENLRLRWCAVPEPWHIERRVVQLLRPPMNREHNDEHPFFDEMGSARGRLRAHARAST
jgi:hypothetical protein